jgi:5'-nucleotidase
MEGVRAGIPAVAVSYDTVGSPEEAPDYGRAAAFTARLARFLLDDVELPQGILLNVNVPYLPIGRGMKARVTRLGGEAYSNYLVTGKDPQGRNYYWVTGDPQIEVPPEERGTDIGAIADGFVSITPIHLDMTEHSLLDELRTWETRLTRENSEAE